MAITCGHCKLTDQTVAHVKACSGVTAPAARRSFVAYPVTTPAVAPAAFQAPAAVAVINPPAPARRRVTTPGMFLHGADVIQVRPARGSKRLYAKRLVNFNADRLTVEGETVQFEFEYAPGVIFNLDESERMTVEQARPFMLAYKRCLCCNRELRAAKSVERGIGPVCIKYFS